MDPKLSLPVQVTLQDDTLVDDALGSRTWGAAPLLAWELVHTGVFAKQRVLELGAGTGLVGLAIASGAAQMADAETTVVLTDHHPTVLANLRKNLDRFTQRVTSEQVRVACLDWYQVHRQMVGPGSLDAVPAQRTSEQSIYTSADTTAQLLPTIQDDSIHTDSDPTLHDGSKFDVLVAADCIYDPIHPIWIRSVAQRYLSRDDPQQQRHRPLLHIVSPLRATHQTEIAALRATFPPVDCAGVEGGPQLRTLEECEMTGYDDFGGLVWSAAVAVEGESGVRQTGKQTRYLYLKVGWA